MRPKATRAAPIIRLHGTISRYKGLSATPGGKWRTQIFVDGRLLYLGGYRFETDAAIAYNYHAAHYLGNFATLNNLIRIKYMHDKKRDQILTFWPAYAEAASCTALKKPVP